ncbi:MAG TPA: folate family ECF transporter S component [Lachnospiraceae bacterium]|nr:folate family ECF transporter S component [Lachnospiraceae bacterium]
MGNFKKQFTDSLEELKSRKCLAVTAMLIAVGIILGFFSVQITDFIRVGFSGLANELTAYLFGPVVGGIMGGITDILKYILKPTGPFFFGWTLNAILAAVIYGVIFYKHSISLGRILIAKLLVAVLINLVLGTYWLHVMYGQAFFALLPARALKQVASVPLEAVLFYVVAQTLQKAKVFAAVRS